MAPLKTKKPLIIKRLSKVLVQEAGLEPARALQLTGF